MSRGFIFDLGCTQTRVGMFDGDMGDCESKPQVSFPSCIGIQEGSTFVSYADNCKPEDTLVWPFETGHLPTKADWPLKVGAATTPDVNSIAEDWFQYAIMNELREDPTDTTLVVVANSTWTTPMKEILAKLSLPGLGAYGITFIPASVAQLNGFLSDAQLGSINSSVVVDIGASGVRVNAVKFGAKSTVLAQCSTSIGGNAVFKQTGDKEWFQKGTIPDILFHPGGGEKGLAEVVAAVYKEAGGPSHILLCGGLAALPGLKDKLVSECGSLGCALGGVTIDVAADRSLAYAGAANLIRRVEFSLTPKTADGDGELDF